MVGADGASYLSSTWTGRPMAVAALTTAENGKARSGAPRTMARPSTSSMSADEASSISAA